MIRAILIDDSPEARESLRADLQQYCPQVQLVGEADSMRTGLDAIRNTQPNLVFLDIQLGDGDGFQLLDQLGKTQARIIFTTGLSDQAIRAIKFSALDYLLKPIDADDLVAAVEKFDVESKRFANENLSLLADLLQQQTKSPAEKLKRLALNSADRVHVINTAEIIRCESERNYTTFFMQNGKQIVVTRTLKEYEELLDPLGFVRVHHSHLINLNQLKEFVKADGGYAIMNDGAQVPVSVRKKDDLLHALGLS
jgi:two-component system, LytTR family, response regulator